jgi:hypothetical protein
MKRVRRLMATITAIWMLAAIAACRDQASKNTTTSAKETALSAGRTDSADEMTAEHAIKLVKALAKDGNLRATLNLSYTKTRTERTPCGDAELVYDSNTHPQNPELWLCKSVTGKPPFYKTTTVDEETCCRTRQVTLPADVRWDASRSADGVNWHVASDFNIEGTQYHAVWAVDSKSKKVSQLPGI